MVFDPYQEWLKVPADRPSPSDRELLGVSPEETDPERIREAFTERYAHVRKYVLSHCELASRILDERSGACNRLIAEQPNGEDQLPDAVDLLNFDFIHSYCFMS